MHFLRIFLIISEDSSKNISPVVHSMLKIHALVNARVFSLLAILVFSKAVRYYRYIRRILMNTSDNKHLNRSFFWLIASLVLSLILVIPYLILAENSIITYHDQLDGEIFTYILGAKYLFTGIDTYPELMNGLRSNGLVPPAPAMILFFKLFKPYTAYVISKIFICFVSLFFIYLLLNELGVKPIVSIGCSVTFSLLPFYMVYGLCIPGLPMLVYSFIRLRQNSKDIVAYVLIAFYGINSSLSLIGYGIIISLGFYVLYLIISRQKVLGTIIGSGILCVCYMLENINLVKQLLGIGEPFISHKSEIIRYANPFLDSMSTILFDGVTYTESKQLFFIPIIIIAVILALVDKYSKQPNVRIRSLIKKLSISLILLVIYSMLYSFISGDIFTNIVNSTTGALHDFDLSRFSWIMPVFWYMALGLSVSIVIEFFANNRFLHGLSITACVVSLSLTAFAALYSNDLKFNIIKLLHHNDYYMMTWDQFYAEDLFEEVDKLIGKDKTEYKVVSYGIYPAAATYNGFYCLDAYSNNYDVNYKHEFRKIIEPALNESDYLTEWYDKWGNRCYIVQPETNNYFTFEKRWTPYIDTLNLNLDALRDMGCEYIISASYVINPGECGLTLLNPDEVPIQSGNSWYRLWVYTF